MIDIDKYFKDGDVSEIYFGHTIEHLNYKDAARVIGKFFKLLADGGVLTVKFPDIDKVCKNYVSRIASIDETLKALYGEIAWCGEYGLHKSGWNTDRVLKALSSVGFRDIAISDGTMHGKPKRDSKVIAKKD